MEYRFQEWFVCPACGEWDDVSALATGPTSPSSAGSFRSTPPTRGRAQGLDDEAIEGVTG